MRCSGWVAIMRNLHSRCCLRCSTAILLQVPLVSFVCYGNVFTYEVDGCFAMSFLLLPFVPQLVSGKWRKKNKKVERVGILLWCETLIYSTWGRQTLALACISSLFLLHATVFSFFLSGGKRVTVSIIFRMSVVLCLCVNSLSLWWCLFRMRPFSSSTLLSYEQKCSHEMCI